MKNLNGENKVEVTTADVSQDVQDTLARNLKATAKAKKKSSKPSFNKKGGKRSKVLKAATTSLADVFKALEQN